MLTAIYMSDDELELKQTLEANSPLSDQVLIAYMERFNVPDTYFMDVMALNAEVNQELLGLLKQRVQDMPQAIAAEIATIMVNNPEVLTEARLTRTLDQSSAEMGMALFTYLDNLATDEQVADLLENHTILWPENQIASLMEKEQWVEASALIGDYCSQASQSTAMQVLYTTEMSLRQELRRMTPEELVEVQAILNQESPATEAYCKAKCMLMEQGVEVPQVIRRLFVQPQERLARNQDNSRETVLAVFPNPADDYCKVELAEPAGADATIELIAPSGQVVDVLALEAGSTSTYLYLEGVAVGTYQLIYRQTGIQLGQTTLIIVQ
jgi:hypothetical protein